ncbi:MAG: major facilitator superfamily 1 [Gemmatimonadetes bacterium]|nr:major facilitator superfamily 1 [Gemmatimonadota bacterium]
MTEKPRLSFWQMFNMSFGFLGIQFGWGLQLANMSAIYEKLGARPDQVPLLWLAAPVTGLLIQPIVGLMSDRTWGPLGRRRPYFLTGAILASLALFFMPTSNTLWAAASLLWILDASINVSMEPFRAFVADKLGTSQRTAGFAMQSFFIGVGASFANAMPFLLHRMGVTGTTPSGIPLTVKYSFEAGAVFFLIAVLWTVFTTGEEPPEDEVAWRRAKTPLGVRRFFGEIGSAIRDMPVTMKQLAVVQFFTWLGLFCMWLFFVPTVARHVFGATDPRSELYTRGMEWGGFSFAFYSITCFLVAFALPAMARATSRRATHAVALVCGGVALLSVYFIHDPYVLLLTMVGVGIAWASILSMPYAILSGSLPAERMGVYMGIFNFFIVIPEIIFASASGRVIRALFGENDPNASLYMVLLGGVCLLVAAGTVSIVRDVEHAGLALDPSAGGDPAIGLADTESERPAASA